MACVTVAHAEGGKGPFSDVPKAHWAYAAIEAMEHRGVFTGYPAGTFSGRRALSRYEFAVAVPRMATDLSRGVEVGGESPEQQLRAAALEGLGLLRRREATDFAKLVAEFEPELKSLGTTAERVNESAGAGRRQARSVPPAPATPSRDYARGVQEARDQWMRGEVVLYAAGLPNASFDDKLGVPHRYVAGCLVSNQDQELMAGHNSEVYRLALERGLPSNHRREWLAELKDPARMWSGDRAPRMMLAWDVDFVPIAKSALRVRLRQQTNEPLGVLEAERDGQVIATLGLGNARKDGPAPEIAWAAGGELLFVRYATNANEGRGQGHLVLDTRTGDLIARGFSSGPPRCSCGRTGLAKQARLQLEVEKRRTQLVGSK